MTNPNYNSQANATKRLSDFREGNRRGELGLYLGHRLNQLPLRYYHHLCCITAREDLDRYFREMLQQSAVAEALKAD